MHSVYVNVAFNLSSWDIWYSNLSISALKPGAFKTSTNLGIIPCSSIYARMSESNDKLNNSLNAIWSNSWLLHGINLLSFSTIPSSFISVLFSPKMLSFFRKFNTMNRRSGLFRSNIEQSCAMIDRFFILRSIWRSSARLRRRWKATNRTFSYFLTMMANFRSSLRICSPIYWYSGVPCFASISSIFVLNSLTLRI